MPTGVVDTVKLAVTFPAGTVTEAGTVALAELLAKLMMVPDVPAGPVRVIVPVELAPPSTEGGFKVKMLRLAGVMVSV